MTDELPIFGTRFTLIREGEQQQYRTKAPIDVDAVVNHCKTHNWTHFVCQERDYWGLFNVRTAQKFLRHWSINEPQKFANEEAAIMHVVMGGR